MATIDPLVKVSFDESLEHVLQQKNSKLEATVRVKTQTGIETSVDRIGTAEPVKRKGKYQPTPVNDVAFNRRWIMSDIYDWATLVDDDDQLKLMMDPTSDLSEAAKMGMQRLKDKVIVDALFATAPYGVKSTDGTVNFPASQIIADGGTGLTFDKINQARELLDEAEVPDDDPRYFLFTSEQITELMNEPKLTSADYVTIRAIQAGRFDGEFLGFQWIRMSKKILKKTGQIRQLGAYTRNSMAIVKPKDLTTRIDERADLSYTKQIFASMRIGAVRCEEQGVVQINVKERA